MPQAQPRNNFVQVQFYLPPAGQEDTWAVTVDTLGVVEIRPMTVNCDHEPVESQDKFLESLPEAHNGSV